MTVEHGRRMYRRQGRAPAERIPAPVVVEDYALPARPESEQIRDRMRARAAQRERSRT